ncbi:MAG: STAS domain-containing protein [Isosphaeraceae bacterium]
MLSYSSHEAGGVLIFTVEEAGEDQYNTSQREWLYKTIETRDDPRFVIDLGALNYLASSDIGLLITVKRRIDARKGKVVITNVDPFIMDIFKTMRIDKLFTFTTDLPSAVAALNL